MLNGIARMFLSGLVYTPEEMIDVEHVEVPEAKQEVPVPEQSKMWPTITKKMFESACKRVLAGEIEVYDKVLDSFTLTEIQRKEFDEVWQKGCIAADKLNQLANEEH